MSNTPLHLKSFRYRNGSETNRQVLVTAQNQNSLRGFDITGMSPNMISKLQTSWNRISNRNMPLTKKESSVISRVKAPFKSFTVSKIRYFHDL